MSNCCAIFFTTSVFFFRKYGDDSEENTKNLRKYLMRLLKIYLIWTVIYLPYTIWDQYQAGFSILGVFLHSRFLLKWKLLSSMVFTCFDASKCDCLLFIQRKRFGVYFKVSLGAYFIGYLINVYTPVWESIPGINFFLHFHKNFSDSTRWNLFWTYLCVFRSFVS